MVRMRQHVTEFLRKCADHRVILSIWARCKLLDRSFWGVIMEEGVLDRPGQRAAAGGQGRWRSRGEGDLPTGRPPWIWLSHWNFHQKRWKALRHFLREGRRTQRGSFSTPFEGFMKWGEHLKSKLSKPVQIHQHWQKYICSPILAGWCGEDKA